ncbi:hypothetical protein AAC387_Pa10g1858 [Persea americana]
MGGMLSKKPHDPNQQLPVTAPVAGPTNETDLTDISFKAGFHSLSLDSVIKITCLPLETNEEAMKMMIESKEHTWKDKNLTQDLQEYFTITSNLLLWRTKNEEASTLERYIRESQSLEEQLRAYYTKITGRKKMTYFLLQLVASIFAMIPLIGPLYVTLYVANAVNTKRSILLSSGFLVIGVIGNGGLWFWKRKRNALGVQEELIGPLLMSMVFRNKDLTMQNPDFNALEVRLRSDRNLILQKLGAQKESTSSPEFTIRSDVLAADYSSSDRTTYY